MDCSGGMIGGLAFANIGGKVGLEDEGGIGSSEMSDKREGKTRSRKGSMMESIEVME